MLYIITEDSNSARDFWECAAKAFRLQGEYVLVPFLKGKDGKDASGNTTLNEQVSNLFSDLKEGDTLFVAFDNISNTTKFNPYNFIIKISHRCRQLGVAFKFTEYYCFEELYLSYQEVLDMYIKSEKKNQIVEDALKYVQANLDNQTNYFDNSNEIQRYISVYNDAGRNREHFANSLLMNVTMTFKGHLLITKSSGIFHKQGECWLKDCSDVQSRMVLQQKNKICGSQCMHCCRNQTTKEKLIDLEKRSLCKDSGFHIINL